jgi:hypothetical protein
MLDSSLALRLSENLSSRQFVISNAVRDLAFFNHIETKDFSAEFILSSVEGPRNDNSHTLWRSQ